ncbi:MAG: hypothetical protein WHS87_02815 [Anaerolineales bacterium]
MSTEDRFPIAFGERLRSLLILVLLPLALIQWLPLATFTFTVQLPGFYLAQPISLRAGVTLIVAGLAAAGMDWLIRSHPLAKGNTFPHLLFPFLTTLALGGILPFIPGGILWWSAFLFGAVLLALVFTAEFITLDSAAPFFPLASGGLTLLGVILFLLIASSLRFVSMRLALLLPTLGLVTFLLSLRLFRLYLPQRWELYWSLGLALLVLQIAAPLHYWPLAVTPFGLMLAGSFYGLFSTAVALVEGNLSRWTVVEAVWIVLGSWGLALWLNR